MRQFLVALGVPEDRIVMEGKSLNTIENMRETRALVGTARVALVTSGYHMPRALRLARRAGLNAEAFPTDWQVLPTIGAVVGIVDAVGRCARRFRHGDQGVSGAGLRLSQRNRDALIHDPYRVPPRPPHRASRRGRFRPRRPAAGAACPPAARPDARQSELPDRLARPGRAWRLLPGDRRRPLSQGRHRVRPAPGRAQPQHQPAPARRPRRHDHVEQLRGLHLCARERAVLHHRRDLPEGSAGPDRPSRYRLRQLREAQGPHPADRRRRAG